MSTTPEEAVAFVRASVMIYDDGAKRWLPAGYGGQNVESKVQLFQNVRTSTFRIVARKGPEHEVVLNCPLYASMKYNQTTATFHQWRNEHRQLHGLNFVSPDDAQRFGQAMCKAIEALSHAAVALGSGQQQVAASQNGTYDHQHNGLSGVASAPVLMRQQQQQPGQYQQAQQQHYAAHASSVGEYGVQQQTQFHNQQHRGSHDDVQQQQIHHSSHYHQQQPINNEAHYGVSPALHLQQHQRQPSAGSNSSSSGSSNCTNSQASNLIYSTVTPANVMPSPSRPAPPVPPPPPPMSAPSKVPAPVTVGGNIPPAPPPPPPSFNATNGGGAKQPTNLAQAISNQKLRKVPSGTTPSRPSADEATGMNKDCRSASVGCVDATMTPARAAGSGNNSGSAGGSHSDVMSEMAATLARRRLLAESGTGGAGATTSGPTNAGSDVAAAVESAARLNEKACDGGRQKTWEARNGSRPSLNEAPSSSTDSPRTHRKVPSGSSLSSQEDVGLSLMTGVGSGNIGGGGGVGPAQRSLSNGPTSGAAPFLVTAETLEQWKQEILNEVKREINKAKMDIIESLKAELNRR